MWSNDRRFDQADDVNDGEMGTILEQRALREAPEYCFLACEGEWP